MLVLSRKTKEQILLKTPQETITLTVVRIDGNKIRLGIDATKNVEIVRAELEKPKENLAEKLADRAGPAVAPAMCGVRREDRPVWSGRRRPTAGCR